MVIYSQVTCPPCHQAKAWLSDQQIPYQEKDIRKDPIYIDELIRLGSQMTPTFIIGEKVLIGFDPTELLETWNSYKE